MTWEHDLIYWLLTLWPLMGILVGRFFLCYDSGICQ